MVDQYKLAFEGIVGWRRKRVIMGRARQGGVECPPITKEGRTSSTEAAEGSRRAFVDRPGQATDIEHFGSLRILSPSSDALVLICLPVVELWDPFVMIYNDRTTSMGRWIR